MGGNLVINYTLRYKPEISGLIATGPWLKLTNPPGLIKKKFAEAVDKIWPTFSTYNSIKPDDLSHEKRVVEESTHDELMHPWISVHTYLSVAEAGCWALEHAVEFEYPAIILHGGSDKVTSVEASKEFAFRAGPNCKLKIFAELYHEIHNEPRNAEIFGEIVNWLSSQINP